MVSRTRIPVSITKSGDGDKHVRENIIQDYPCGSEPGHSFRSSPLNIYAIGNSSELVLYVEGGCPNFTWVSDNAWADFGTAETAARYNTIASGAGPGQDTVVTVTDVNGLEVTINVPWSGACSCCDDVLIEFAKQTAWAEIESINWPGEVVVFLDGGCPPFDWTISGANFTLDYAQTNSRRNRLHGAAGADSDNIYLAIEDFCGVILCYPGVIFGTRPCSFIAEGESQTITITRALAPLDWEFVGDCIGWTLTEAQTADLDNIVTAIADPTTKTVTLKVTDVNGCDGTKTLYSADALEFQEAFGHQPSLVTISTGMAFACCEGESDYGEAYTFSIGTDMQIAQLDKLIFTDVYSALHSVCKAHSGVMCTAYQLTGTGAMLEAFLVDGSGNITQHANNTCQFHTSATDSLNTEPSYEGSGVVVAVTYHAAGYAFAASIAVDAVGEVNPTRLDYLQLTTGFGRDCHFTMISDTIGICVYTAGSYYLYARLFSVAGDGTLALVGNETQISDFAVYDPRAVKITDNWVVVSGAVTLAKGYVWALEVSGTSIVANTGYAHKFDDTGLVTTTVPLVISSSRFLVLSNEGAGGDYGGHYWLFDVSLGSEISWTDTYHYDYGDMAMNYWGACLPRTSILLESYHDTANDGWLRTRRIC